MINQIHNENCLSTMARMPPEFVDLVITSPPYDNLRDYYSVQADILNAIHALKIIVKHGGVVVWVVGDATVEGSETLTSFSHAFEFRKVGFLLHDTMIYEKSGFANPSNNRYHQVFEYMFVFSKGKPKCFNPIKDRANKYVGIHGGERSYRAEFGMRTNIWRYENGGNNDSSEHPAPFPEKLAYDHILSWSNPDEIVYDPFMGSGTTAKMSIMLHRRYIGSEISADYCKLAEKRLERFTRALQGRG